MKLANKNVTVFKVIVGIISFIIGLLTLVFSILNLAKVSNLDSAVALRITVGIMLCVLGLANSIILFIDNGEFKLAVVGSIAVTIGFGIFLFTDYSSGVIQSIVSIAFPIIAAAFGGVLLIKSIIELARKSGNKHIFYLLMSITLLITGILFAIYHKNLKDIIWLFVGLAIMISSILFIVAAAKNKSSVKVQVTNNN